MREQEERSATPPSTASSCSAASVGLAVPSASLGTKCTRIRRGMLARNAMVKKIGWPNRSLSEPETHPKVRARPATRRRSRTRSATPRTRGGCAASETPSWRRSPTPDTNCSAMTIGKTPAERRLEYREADVERDRQVLEIGHRAPDSASGRAGDQRRRRARADMNPAMLKPFSAPRLRCRCRYPAGAASPSRTS